jgi:hypothetical protein
LCDRIEMLFVAAHESGNGHQMDDTAATIDVCL